MVEGASEGLDLDWDIVAPPFPRQDPIKLYPYWKIEHDEASMLSTNYQQPSTNATFNLVVLANDADYTISWDPEKLSNPFSRFEISDKSVALILKRYAEKAGLDSTKYAGHSLRSGFATTAAEFGAEERNIMAMTGHKTTQMVRRYIQEANLFKNNALNKIKI